MPKYVSLFKYTAEAYKGLLKEKASARTAVLKQMVDGFGGRLESIYWGGGGEYSGVVILDFPDFATYVAFGTLLESSGAFAAFKIFEVLTSEEIDHALEKTVPYRPPGA